MRRILIALFSGVLILTACRQVPTGDAQDAVVTPAAVTQESTNTPSPIPTNTHTLVPTASPTASTTPLPTIPTFTPTFDASTIVTVTPAPSAICPKENPEVVAVFSDPYIYYFDDILTYLNSGGALDQLANLVSEPNSGRIIDLTGDGINELVMRAIVSFYIVGCTNGNYELLLQTDSFVFGSDFTDVVDLNANGIPELIFLNVYSRGDASIHIYEWDDSEFRPLIEGDSDAFILTSMYKIMDTNGDGLKEIVIAQNFKEFEKQITIGNNRYFVIDPYRDETITLGWNGQYFVNIKQENYIPPKYRFQAIQDGDRQTRFGNYSGALSFYQDAIISQDLEWWSPERRDYESYVYLSQSDSEPIVTPSPIPDNTEYPRLAAYAYYRIMLLHLMQGNELEAEAIYRTLQEKFGNDQYAQPYVEMAMAFWDAYQSTHKMYDGCAAAIQYAVEHPEILIPLGSDYHGWQSHAYVPADVCPFR